jgi:flagellar basal-body rod modification protein FlgD
VSTISSTNGTNNANGASPLFSAAGGNQALGKDSFLKLLVAQIANQDPLKPMDDTAYVAQLAQFSSLEQQTTSNKMLELLATQQQGLANTAALGLVGKDVTVRGGSVTLGGDGVGAVAPFKLADGAEKVQVVVRDGSGNVVRRADLGAQDAGRVDYRWDGRSDSGVSMPAGRYSVSVEATKANGQQVGVELESTGRVKAVSFEGGIAKLVLDSGLTVSASDLVKVQS